MEHNLSQLSVFILIIVGVISVMVLLLFNLLLTSRNRRLRFKSEVQQMQLNFKEEMNAIRMEVADNTLKEVARDLHDEVGQLLTFSILQIGNLRKTPEDKQEAMMNEVQSSVKDALEAVRSISRGLSPDIVNTFGLRPSIEQLFERASKRTGLQFEIEMAENLTVHDPAARIITFHLIRESLTNAVRHAEATMMKLRMFEEDEQVTMQFIDNGKGLSAEAQQQPSLGLVSMKNRASLINGTFEIKPAPGKGTIVEFSFPNKAIKL